MLNQNNVVGENPKFYVLNDYQAIDIDTMIEFEFAEFLYNKTISETDNEPKKNLDC